MTRAAVAWVLVLLDGTAQLVTAPEACYDAMQEV
jgi:hypothetical protein